MVQIFFIFIPIWGNDPIWRAYFSDGLKPPTSKCMSKKFIPWTLENLWLFKSWSFQLFLGLGFFWDGSSVLRPSKNLVNPASGKEIPGLGGILWVFRFNWPVWNLLEIPKDPALFLVGHVHHQPEQVRRWQRFHRQQGFHDEFIQNRWDWLGWCFFPKFWKEIPQWKCAKWFLLRFLVTCLVWCLFLARRCGPSSVCLAQHEMCTASCFQDEQCEMFPMRICGSINWLGRCWESGRHIMAIYRHPIEASKVHHWVFAFRDSFWFCKVGDGCSFWVFPVRGFHDCIIGGCKTNVICLAQLFFWGDSKVWKCRHKALFGAGGWVAWDPSEWKMRWSFSIHVAAFFKRFWRFFVFLFYQRSGQLHISQSLS